MSAPIVKWAGGKRRLLPEILKRIPPTFGRYFEPFAGGAALFFELADQLAPGAVLGDVNRGLIATYLALAAYPEGVAAHLVSLAACHNAVFDARECYTAVRNRWNARTGDMYERAAMFLYLNRACFNGLWRVNRRGEFNTPIGRSSSGADLSVPSTEELMTAGAALARAEMFAGDFAATIATARPGDLVYLDPPYDTEGDGFTGYAAGGFGPPDQIRLAALARALVDRGVTVIASNADTPRVRQIYAGLRIEPVSARRSIVANGDRENAPEVLICGGPLDPQAEDNL